MSEDHLYLVRIGLDGRDRRRRPAQGQGVATALKDVPPRVERQGVRGDGAAQGDNAGPGGAENRIVAISPNGRGRPIGTGQIPQRIGGGVVPSVVGGAGLYRDNYGQRQAGSKE